MRDWAYIHVHLTKTSFDDRIGEKQQVRRAFTLCLLLTISQPWIWTWTQESRSHIQNLSREIKNYVFKSGKNSGMIIHLINSTQTNPNEKSEIHRPESLEKKKKEAVMVRLCIGHTKMKHSFQLKREPLRNFELRPLLNPRGSPVLIPLAITGYKL